MTQTFKPLRWWYIFVLVSLISCQQQLCLHGERLVTVFGNVNCACHPNWTGESCNRRTVKVTTALHRYADTEGEVSLKQNLPLTRTGDDAAPLDIIPIADSVPYKNCARRYFLEEVRVKFLSIEQHSLPPLPLKEISTVHQMLLLAENELKLTTDKVSAKSGYGLVQKVYLPSTVYMVIILHVEIPTFVYVVTDVKSLILGGRSRGILKLYQRHNHQLVRFSRNRVVAHFNTCAFWMRRWLESGEFVCDELMSSSIGERSLIISNRLLTQYHTPTRIGIVESFSYKYSCRATALLHKVDLPPVENFTKTSKMHTITLCLFKRRVRPQPLIDLKMSLGYLTNMHILLFKMVHKSINFEHSYSFRMGLVVFAENEKHSSIMSASLKSSTTNYKYGVVSLERINPPYIFMATIDIYVRHSMSTELNLKNVASITLINAFISTVSSLVDSTIFLFSRCHQFYFGATISSKQHRRCKVFIEKAILSRLVVFPRCEASYSETLPYSHLFRRTSTYSLETTTTLLNSGHPMLISCISHSNNPLIHLFGSESRVATTSDTVEAMITVFKRSMSAEKDYDSELLADLQKEGISVFPEGPREGNGDVFNEKLVLKKRGEVHRQTSSRSMYSSVIVHKKTDWDSSLWSAYPFLKIRVHGLIGKVIRQLYFRKVCLTYQNLAPDTFGMILIPDVDVVFTDMHLSVVDYSFKRYHFLRVFLLEKVWEKSTDLDNVHLESLPMVISSGNCVQDGRCRIRVMMIPVNTIIFFTSSEVRLKKFQTISQYMTAAGFTLASSVFILKDVEPQVYIIAHGIWRAPTKILFHSRRSPVVIDQWYQSWVH